MERIVCIKTTCCAVQRNETYRIAEFFRVNGWKETENVAVADIVVITTCGVTDSAENESLELINDVLGSVNTNCTVVVSGCLPNICINKLTEKFPKVKCISMDKLEAFDLLIDANMSISDVSYNAGAKLHHSVGDPRLDTGKYDNELLFAKDLCLKNNTNAFLEAYNYTTQGRYLWQDESIYEIKISSGCNQNCSYCASRLGIGNYKSKDIYRIMNELEAGISLGYKNIMLMGDELGAYGIDIGTSLIQLLKKILESHASIKIGIRYIYPSFFHDLIVELKQYLNRIFFVCVSIQSASSSVLSKMNREDNIKQVEDDIINLRENYPHIYIHTQIMIGFPNETNEDFYRTMTFLNKCRFDFIRYNVFSPRNHTAAYNLEICYTEEDLNMRLRTIKEFCLLNRKTVLYDRYIKIFNSVKVGDKNDVSIG